MFTNTRERKKHHREHFNVEADAVLGNFITAKHTTAVIFETFKHVWNDCINPSPVILGICRRVGFGVFTDDSANPSEAVAMIRQDSRYAYALGEMRCELERMSPWYCRRCGKRFGSRAQLSVHLTSSANCDKQIELMQSRLR